MYLKWNRSRHNTASTAHKHACPNIVCQLTKWRGCKTKLRTMWRSVFIDSSTCHKFISCHNLVSLSIPFHVGYLVKVSSADVFSCLHKNCHGTVGFPLPLQGKKLHFIAARAMWVLHILIFHDDFQRLEHFCLNTAIRPALVVAPDLVLCRISLTLSFLA